MPCPTCELPAELCVCGDLDSDGHPGVAVTEVRRADGVETVLWGFGPDDPALDAFAVDLETLLRAEATVHEGRIAVDGEHVAAAEAAVEERDLPLRDTDDLPPALRQTEPDAPADIRVVSAGAPADGEWYGETYNCGPERAAAYLLVDDRRTRRAAAAALASWGSGPPKYLAHALADPDEQVRHDAVRATAGRLKRHGPVDDPTALAGPLADALDAPEDVRLRALQALAHLFEHHAEAVDADGVLWPVVDCLDQRPRIRRVAALALGYLGDERALDALATLRRRADEGTASHNRAQFAISRIED